MSVLTNLRFVANHPLNQGQKALALTRFFKWQIGSRLVPGDVIYNWVNGAMLAVRPGETGLTGNIYCGLHDFPEMAFLMHVLRKEDLFVDVGANVGSYTILACAAAGARGCSLEPVPATYTRLMRNIYLNNLGSRVRCLNQGVGSQIGKIKFTAGRDCANHVAVDTEQAHDEIEVDMSTLDEVLGEEGPSVMKIDVEGYETSVLQGAEETLKKETLHSIVMELNGSGERYGFDESHILRTMKNHGFQIYRYEPLTRKLVPLAGKNSESDNTLFVRREEFVLERLKNAAAIDIHGKRI